MRIINLLVWKEKRIQKTITHCLSPLISLLYRLFTTERDSPVILSPSASFHSSFISIFHVFQDWTLKIRFVQPRDAGIYECSISTHPPSSIFVTLNVVGMTNKGEKKPNISSLLSLTRSHSHSSFSDRQWNPSPCAFNFLSLPSPHHCRNKAEILYFQFLLCFKSTSHFLHLSGNVMDLRSESNLDLCSVLVEAHAEIPGGPDKYIKSGSTLRLVCEFKLSTEQPEYVFWFQVKPSISISHHKI